MIYINLVFLPSSSPLFVLSYLFLRAFSIHSPWILPPTTSSFLLYPLRFSLPTWSSPIKSTSFPVSVLSIHHIPSLPFSRSHSSMTPFTREWIRGFGFGARRPNTKATAETVTKKMDPESRWNILAAWKIAMLLSQFTVLADFPVSCLSTKK